MKLFRYYKGIADLVWDFMIIFIIGTIIAIIIQNKEAVIIGTMFSGTMLIAYIILDYKNIKEWIKSRTPKGINTTIWENHKRTRTALGAMGIVILFISGINLFATKGLILVLNIAGTILGTALLGNEMLYENKKIKRRNALRRRRY